jgi:hypothetical protein
MSWPPTARPWHAYLDRLAAYLDDTEIPDWQERAVVGLVLAVVLEHHLPPELSNGYKLDNSEHNDERSSGTTRVMRMQLQRRSSGLPEWLYIAIVVALGLYFVIGGIAWATFIWNGVAVPDSFTTILATIAGGLVGVLAPTGGAAPPSQPRQEEQPPPAD